jgi:hypothetical protein
MARPMTAQREAMKLVRQRPRARLRVYGDGCSDRRAWPTTACEPGCERHESC